MYLTDRYDERMKYICSVLEKNKMKSSYEDFAQSVMHPLESSSHLTTNILFTMPTGSGILKDPTTQQMPLVTAPVTMPSFTGQSLTPIISSQSGGSPDTSRWSLSPRVGVSSILKLPGYTKLDRTIAGSPSFRRPRASTNDERMSNHRTKS